MRTIPILLQAAAALLAYSRVVIAAPAATRSVVAYPPFTRQDVAECGISSKDGERKCPLNICCSSRGWCGMTADHCNNDCQQGFGSCKISELPSCNGTSAATRRVGYYLSYSIDRSCDAVPPSTINTTGLTNINFAFALFDAVNFDFYPERGSDDSIYKDFTALKTSTLQTWIAIGGGAFNDPTSSTRNNWAIMTRSSVNRAKWISNLTKYMDKYGFQGCDIDWEWPGDITRGGTDADIVNFVILLKEMRVAFGSKYGLSTALTTDIAALQYINVKAMEKYVDFFNFMSYDYHSPVDSPTPDDTALPHTDITETDTKLNALWLAGITPAKVNLGLAYYGMTYTMTGSSCNGVGCPYSGRGTAGACTGDAGMLSNLEINHIIATEKTSTKLIPKKMVKQTTYGVNQLILYDDADTYGLKTDYANSKCLGGTMLWSIDQGI